MGTYDALYTAVSGMNANQTAISVIGDNLANLNTVGFKASRANFQDVLGQTLLGSAGAQRTGQGVSLQNIEALHTQGGFQSTGYDTDLAISGNGFFVVRDADGAASSNHFTRAGQFRLNSDGFLVTPGEMRLQGYAADSNGVLSSSLSDLCLDDVTTAPEATSTITTDGNLDPSADAIDAAVAFDPADSDSYNHKTSFLVHDSLGETHSVEVYYRKSSAGEWEWHAYDEGDTTTELGTGGLTFDTSGELSATTGAGTISFTPDNGAAAMNVAMDFGTIGEDGAVTQHGGSRGYDLVYDADGSAAASLTSVTVENDGSVLGSFENGESQVLAQVALATFDGVEGLERQGGNLWSMSTTSGQPHIGAAGDGGRGLIYAGAVETSNVDITSEFVHLIEAQRGFQAASRTVTTVDSLLQEAVNLKR